jgi:hypothetical protein
MEEFAPYARGRLKRQGAGRELRRAALVSGVLCRAILGGAASAGSGSGFAAAAIGVSGFRPRFAMRDVLVESPWTKRSRSNRQSRWPDIGKGNARPMSVLNIDRPDCLNDEGIAIFRESVGKFLDQHAPESRAAKWREDGVVDRAMWTEAAEASLLCLSIPEAYGGAGDDYRHEVVLNEEIAKRRLCDLAP